jgi:predicted Fe-S protein YdhL (DUF1289 family)
MAFAMNDATYDPPAGTPVPSPCVSICRMDPQTALCVGCLRTLDEIASWGLLDDDGRRSVWRAIIHRRAARR